MKTTLLLLLAASALAWIGNDRSRSCEERSRKAETLEIRISQLEAEAKSLPAAAPAAVQSARNHLENLQTQTATLLAQVQESSLARAESVRATKIQEASAKRAEKTLSPSLRPLLAPAPADMGPEAVAKRSAESSLLQALLACEIDEIDYLALGEPGTASKTSNIEIYPVEIRFRAKKMGDLSRFLSRLHVSSDSLPLHRVARIEMRPLPAESGSARPNYLVDLRLQALLPKNSR